MEFQQSFAHEHPLAFNEVVISNLSQKTYCSRCDEVMSGPNFSCTVEGCGFYLHKRCAEAPSEINHPFHSKHPLLLLPDPSYSFGEYVCDFCGEASEKFVYHCSCNIDLHIKCALFTYNIAKKSFRELQHIPHIDPSMSSGQFNNEEELESADCGINLRKICSQFPFEMDCLSHRKHPLTLQFVGEGFSCRVCHESQVVGFVYYCLVCDWALHINCRLLPSPPSQINHPFHSKHPLALLPNPSYSGGRYICSFCGKAGEKFVYHCSCNIDLHIKCALFTYNIAKISFGELQHIPHIDTSMSIGQFNNEEELENADCGINLRKLCAQLPFEMDCLSHRKHPLTLQFVGEGFSCRVCHESQVVGFVYYCLACDWALHINCSLLPSPPSQINHPFHSKHPLALLPNPSYSYGRYICNFCGKAGEKFVYHCSCNIDLHIVCALFTKNIANKSFGELEHIPHIDPLISAQDNIQEELESAKCYGCWKPLLGSIYFSTDCGFNLHKRCAELPLEVDCFIHRNHPLTLQFVGSSVSCKVCHETQLEGFVYCCLPCNVALHIDCVSPPQSLKDKCHPQHTLTLFWKQLSFICNVCGKEGDSIPYICSTCGLMVHKKCISLPQAIKLTLHDHPIIRSYFLRQDGSKKLDCQVCFDEVNTEYGSYYCSKCEFIVHVNCALELEDWYYEVDLEDKDELDRLAILYDMSTDSNSITEVIERNEAGKAIIIRHFSHAHDLVLSDKVMDDAKCCDGCMLLITSPFFYCLQCNFLLHKSCAELLRKKTIWYEKCQHPFILTSLDRFECEKCECLSTGFAYECRECDRHICVRCVIPFTFKHEGHEHPLLYVHKCEDARCNACGKNVGGGYVFKCKNCDFALAFRCLALPQTVKNKYDKHVLKLTYRDDNDYSESHFCDICEEKRDPKHWFYHCALCDTSIHTNCVLNDLPFIKVGITSERKFHPHPLTYVRKVYYYPACVECDRPCQGLALECLESGCNYINCLYSPCFS